MTATLPRASADCWSAADTATCVLLFAFTCWYCAAAPYNLYVYDEGYFLYEAKRIVQGDVFYRDFFNIVAPLAWYIMAAAYWAFGVSMATARTTMAVVHGVIAVGSVVACRSVGVRLAIAAMVGLSETAVCYMATERAGPHWFGTLWCLVVLLALLRRSLTPARDAFLIGTVVGALALTQQQRGVAMAWVPLAVFVLDYTLLAERGWRPLATRGAAYVAGVTAVVVPVMLGFVVIAGFEQVFTALVRYPLVNYRQIVRVPWGQYNPVQDAYMGPIFKYLSIAVPLIAIGRCVWQWWTGQDPQRLRVLAVVVLVSLGSLLGITYVPGYGYLVLVGPIWFVLVAEMVEMGLRVHARHWHRTWVVTTAIAVAFAVFFSTRLWNRRRELQAQWPFEQDTPFGRMAFASEADMAVLNDVVRRVDETGSHRLFIYPTAPGYYLLTGTDNVTRFQIVSPGYSSPEHMQEIIDTLETRQQPLVIRNWMMWMDNDADPILSYLMQHYQKVPLPFPPKRMRTITLFRRKPDAPEPKTF